MRRLYFLAPDLDSTRRIVDELLLNHVQEDRIHILARDGTELEDLPEAGIRERTDLIPSLERGATIGGATGALAGLVAVAIPGLGILGGGAVLALAAAGTGVGAWSASMQGVSTPNTQLKRFEERIANGEILMMIDVAKSRVDEIENIVRKHHPEAEVAGTEPSKPFFP